MLSDLSDEDVTVRASFRRFWVKAELEPGVGAKVGDGLKAEAPEQGHASLLSQ